MEETIEYCFMERSLILELGNTVSSGSETLHMILVKPLWFSGPQGVCRL